MRVCDYHGCTERAVIQIRERIFDSRGAVAGIVEIDVCQEHNEAFRQAMRELRELNRQWTKLQVGLLGQAFDNQATS